MNVNGIDGRRKKKFWAEGSIDIRKCGAIALNKKKRTCLAWLHTRAHSRSFQEKTYWARISSSRKKNLWSRTGHRHPKMRNSSAGEERKRCESISTNLRTIITYCVYSANLVMDYARSINKCECDRREEKRTSGTKRCVDVQKCGEIPLWTNRYTRWVRIGLRV